MLKRILIFVSVLALANLYVAWSFYSATGSAWIWGAFALLFAFEILMPILQRKGEGWRRANPWLTPILSVAQILSYFALGGFSIIFFLNAIRDITLLIMHFFTNDLYLERISFLSLEIVLGATVAIMLVGVFQALIGPVVREVEVPLKNLPQTFAGFKIVQISDLHIGPTIREAYVRNVVDTVNKLKPDLVALTGDITDGALAELNHIAKMLSQIEAPRFFVTGNHEYYWNAPEWIKVHRANGTHVLINEHFLFKRGTEQIAILGVPDVSAHHFVPEHISDPQLAAKGVPEGMIKILLAHQPISYKAAYAAGVNLQLSGHTHSGQFFPWSLVIGFFHDFYRDLNRFKEMWIYVNPGTGYWGPPLRTAVASEITLLTLRRA